MGVKAVSQSLTVQGVEWEEVKKDKDRSLQEGTGERSVGLRPGN